MTTRFGPRDEAERVVFVEQALVGEFQAVLQRALDRSGISRQELATRMGVSRARVTQILGTGANLTIHTIARFLDATGAQMRLGLAASRGARRAPRAPEATRSTR